jgi:hypothetical protein
MHSQRRGPLAHDVDGHTFGMQVLEEDTAALANGVELPYARISGAFSPLQREQAMAGPRLVEPRAHG